MLKQLEKRLKQLEKVVIAYSGGIDSAFLLFVANKVLPKENILAVIVNGQMVARKDYKEAIDFLKENKFKYIEIPYNPLDILEFKENHKDRCYYCKKNIMNKIKQVAIENGFENVLDGKNINDTKTYRPGNKATKEIGIISPLEETGFSKEDIRKTAKELGIKFWNKPSNSCLATRFPYNTVLTEEELQKVELAEEIVKDLGIPKTRVRVHNDLAKIEVDKKYFEYILKNEQYINKIKELGYKFVALDLIGLKSGNFD